MSETEVNTEAQVDDNLDTFSTEFFGEKKVDIKAAKPEVEQEVPNTEAEANTEAQDNDVDDDPDAELEQVEEPVKKKQTVQDRINELTRQREEAKREGVAQLEQLRKEFDEKLKALQPEKVVVSEAAEPGPNDIKDNGDPKYPLGEFDPQYIRDLTRFTLETEQSKIRAASEQDRRTQEVNQQQAVMQTNWNTKLQEATTEYPDLVEKGQVLLNGFNDLPSDYAGYLSTVLMSMDQGPAVLYYLSDHPDEARAIVNSGAQKATLALGRIEAKFIEVDAQKKAAKPKVSKAPPPPQERTRGTNGAFISVSPDTDDLDAFQAEFFRKK